MKVLTTAGLTKLIELSKNTFLDKDNVINISDALATVAITGSYNDLTNKPTINDLTTSAQQAALNSGATSTNIAQITTNKNNITTINNKIPAAATSSNQLADKAFVNSSINAVAAYYVTSDTAGDAFATKAALDTGPYYHDGATRTPTENDYAIVAADETKNNACTRYTYTGSQWSFQYVVNDTPFTQAQINAINSGITSTKVSNYDAHITSTDSHVTTNDKSYWNAKQAAITGAASTVTSENLKADRVLVSNSSGKITTSTSITTTELDYLDGVTSSIQTQLNNKQATLVSGTNIKTINSQSILGSGDLAVDGLPSQSGQSGKYLTTNGTSASWANIDALPSQTSQSGKFLTTNGTTASWANIPTELPSQSGQNGKYLKTDGSSASWENVDALPSQTSQSGKFLTTNGTAASWASVSYNNLTNKLTAGTDISISNSNVISNTYPEVYLTDTEYQALVNAGTTDASTYYNTGSNIPGSTDDIISIRSSMSPGDTLKQGYMVLVEV